MDYATYNGTTPNYIVEALPVWQMNINDPSKFPDKYSFECPSCHIKLSLANHGNEFPKRLYFRAASPNRPHSSKCEAYNVTLDEFNKKSKKRLHDEGIISDDVNQNISFTQGSTVKYDSTQNKNPPSSVANQSNNKNSTVSYNSYQQGKTASRNSLRSFYLEIMRLTENNLNWRKTLVSMNWPHKTKKDKKPNITPLQFDHKIPLGDIVIELPNDLSKFKLKKDYVFWGKATVELRDTADYGEQYFFNFLDTPLEAHWGKNTLKGMTNISIMNDAIKSGNEIDLMLCGSFFKFSNGTYGFIKRTDSRTDYIVVN